MSVAQNQGPVSVASRDTHNPEQCGWDIRIDAHLEYRVVCIGAILEPGAVKEKAILDLLKIFLRKGEKEIELKGKDREKAISLIIKKLNAPNTRLEDHVSYSYVKDLQVYDYQTPFR